MDVLLGLTTHQGKLERLGRQGAIIPLTRALRPARASVRDPYHQALGARYEAACSNGPGLCCTPS